MMMDARKPRLVFAGVSIALAIAIVAARAIAAAANSPRSDVVRRFT
jgi:hypothetical protein